jgi:hypothetical protein
MGIFFESTENGAVDDAISLKYAASGANPISWTEITRFRLGRQKILAKLVLDGAGGIVVTSSTTLVTATVVADPDAGGAPRRIRVAFNEVLSTPYHTSLTVEDYVSSSVRGLTAIPVRGTVASVGFDFRVIDDSGASFDFTVDPSVAFVVTLSVEIM